MLYCGVLQVFRAVLPMFVFSWLDDIHPAPLGVLVSSVVCVAIFAVAVAILFFAFQFLRKLPPIQSIVTWIFGVDRTIVHVGSLLVGARISHPLLRRAFMFLAFSGLAVGGAIAEARLALGFLFLGLMCAYFVFRHWWKIEDDVAFDRGAQPIRRNLNVEMVAACACILIFAPVAFAQIRDANLGINFDGSGFAFFGFTISEIFRNGAILQLPFVPHIAAPRPTGIGILAVAIFRLSADVIIIASLKRLLDIAKRAALGLDLQPQIDKLETGELQKCEEAVAQLKEFVLQERRNARQTLEDILKESGRSIISPKVNFDSNVRFLAADAFLKIGETRKDTSSLALASDAFRAIASEDWKHNKPSVDWARVHEKLGDCYTTYGRLEIHLQRLRQALPAYRTAARAYLTSNMPDERAATLVKLGEALMTLGQRESDNVERFNGAANVFRDALRMYDPKRTPDQWRRGQSDLGKTLILMSGRARGSKLRQWLSAAVDAFDAALETDRDNHRSAERLDIQLQLAKTLRRLGEQSSGDVSLSQLERCAQTYSQVLKFYPRHSDPDKWTSIQCSLADVLQTLAERGSQPEKRLEMAISAYHAALEELTRYKSASDWATTMKELGVAQMKHGELTSNITDLTFAVGSFKSALEVYARDPTSPEFTATQTCRGRALVEIGDHQTQAGQYSDAAVTFETAQVVFEQLKLTDEVESTRVKLSNAETLATKAREHLARRGLLERFWGRFLAKPLGPAEQRDVPPTADAARGLRAEQPEDASAE
jgi:tetratricopeptide (TPR) repeat protein